MADGIYAAYYTGSLGFGHAIIVLQKGLLTGADVTGSEYDGTYVIEKLQIKMKIKLKVQAGTTLVSGETLAENQILEFDFVDYLNFADGRPRELRLGGNPVNVIFRRLRVLQ